MSNPLEVNVDAATEKAFWNEWDVNDLAITERTLGVIQGQLSVASVRSLSRTVRHRAFAVEVVLRAACAMLLCDPDDENQMRYIKNKLNVGLASYNLEAVDRPSIATEQYIRERSGIQVTRSPHYVGARSNKHMYPPAEFPNRGRYIKVVERRRM